MNLIIGLIVLGIATALFAFDGDIARHIAWRRYGSIEDERTARDHLERKLRLLPTALAAALVLGAAWLGI